MYNTNITPELADSLLDLFRVKINSFSGVEIIDYSEETVLCPLIKAWKGDVHVATCAVLYNLDQILIRLFIGESEFNITNYELAKLLINLINTDEKTELITTLISTL